MEFLIISVFHDLGMQIFKSDKKYLKYIFKYSLLKAAQGVIPPSLFLFDLLGRRKRVEPFFSKERQNKEPRFRSLMEFYYPITQRKERGVFPNSGTRH